MKDFKKFIAFGGVFEYAETREEVIEQRIRVFPNDEPVTRALTVNLKQFTLPKKNTLKLFISIVKLFILVSSHYKFKYKKKRKK